MEPDQLLGILCNYVSAAIRTRSIPRFDKDILIQAGIQSGQPAKLARFFSNLTQEAGIEPPEPVKVEPVEDWLHQTYSTPLPIDWPLNNVQQYREAFLHSIILHNAKVRRSRREIRCLLGISNSSIKRYLNGARAHNIQQFEEVPVPESVGSREELLTFIRGQIKSVKGFPLSLLINKNGFSQNGHLDYLADEQLSIWVEDPDVTLHVRFQLASEQELNDRSIARRLSELTYKPSTLIPYAVKATIEPPALQNMGQVLSHLRQILQYLTDWHIDADYVIDPQTGTILANGSNARSLVSLILAVQYPRKPA